MLVDFYRIPGKTEDWILDHVRAGKAVFRAEIEAAQQAKLQWKEIEPGKTVQAPPDAVFELVGTELLAAKPAAVEKPEQASIGFATILPMAMVVRPPTPSILK